ncbi:[4Fe-4S] proteins maturation [Malassezia cuniculi]|uniref:[4Fe-4S] proteins maturation n=1 Tax=Malassezia cuniculi TaxID=948313 RepID=A0AAF0EQK1_9BASI|nr:[4Fe-4S] proteins maturation [Malassezia cuniculi]
MLARMQAKLASVAAAENNPHLALRVAVEPGGCHGYQYKLELTEEQDDDDLCVCADSVFTEDGVRLFVDSVSLALIRGSTIDYVTELIGSQFAIRDNPQAKGNGCGCGVSWEPAI